MPLTVAEARLEALKLAVRPGLETDSILETAECYAAFIMKGEEKLADVVIKRAKDEAKKK